MHLSKVNEITNHRITGGSEYGWNCYPDARMLDYESDFAYVNIVYNTKTQEIYEAEISIKTEAWDEDMRPYRWLNPEYKDIMILEAKIRRVKWRKAWDDIKWIDLEVEEDFLEKAKAIFHGKDFDKRVQVPIELEDAVMLELCMTAHKRDITLNTLVEEILQNLIDKKTKELV